MGINDVMKPLNNDSSIVLLLKNPQYARNPNPDLVRISSVWMRIVADSSNQYPDGISPGDPQNFRLKFPEDISKQSPLSISNDSKNK